MTKNIPPLFVSSLANMLANAICKRLNDEYCYHIRLLAALSDAENVTGETVIEVATAISELGGEFFDNYGSLREKP